MTNKPPKGVRVIGSLLERFDEILTPEALSFVATLHRAFEPHRQELLRARGARQMRLDAGELPDFLSGTGAIRARDWRIAPLPAALQRRRVEITGPVERKMIINALNSGADSYLADFEDANTPTWRHQIQGQLNLREAIRRQLRFTSEGGKRYELN